MRKVILVAAMSLVATQAFAGGSRSLSLATTNASQQADEPVTTATVPPQAAQAPAATPPANVRTATTTSASAPPAAAPQAAPAPAVATAQSTAAPVVSRSEVAKPKRRQPSTEARVIRELHRHGIYW